MTMNTIVRSLAVGMTVVALAWTTLAQDPPAESPTIEQRLAAVEAAVARLDTRLALAITRPGEDAGQTEVALAARVMALERSVERLTADLERAERLADNAARAAGDAQREATRAQQAARDAATRAR
jgi:hypothetical protein